MKIYTGNFANVPKYRKSGLEPINIALSARYFTGKKYKWLTPEWSYKDLEEPEYTPLFNKKLSQYNPEKVFKALETLSEGKDIVLCCHEKEGDFCHRHLVAKWLEEKLNIEVKELGKMEEVQLNMF